MIAFIYKKKGRKFWRGRYRLFEETEIHDVSLETKEKQVAQRRLNKLVEELDQESVGLISRKSIRTAADRKLVAHLDEYVRDLEKRNGDSDHPYNVDKLVRRLIKECEWVYPRDVRPDDFVAWRGKQDSKAPKTLNEYLACMRAFLNWMERQERIPANPLRRVERVETEGRERRKRRALTDVEVRRLLAVAGLRAIVYLCALWTGLRRGEIEELIWADLSLDAPQPYLKARASTTKNGKEAKIYLHEELANALKRQRPRNAAPHIRVFERVPSMDQYRADLQAAGIAYKDSLDRQADFHALRHTFCTRLSIAGIPPRQAMELMRHSDLRLTTKVYTDATQLPTATIVDTLPRLAGVCPQPGPPEPVATGRASARHGGAKGTAESSEGIDGQRPVPRTDTK